MSIRYIFNTDGEYVAFLNGDNLFTPEAKWIGFIKKNSTNVYHPNGTYMGQLLDDDRIVKQSNIFAQSPVLPPVPPLTPFRPFAPFQRLPMSPLPYGWQDVFENATRDGLTKYELSNLNQLEGSALYAGDNVFLGNVTKNRYDTKSMGNRFGNYGNRYSTTSIFNPYSQYGSKYSALSPYNKYSTNPPRFIKNGRELGKLTTNSYVANRIDPEKFFSWFEQL